MGDEGDYTGSDATKRRRFLKAVGVLGVTGLAGCGGDGDSTDTATDTEMPADTTTTTTTADTPTDTTTTTTTTTTTADTPTDTPTDTPAQPLGDPPEPLLSLGGASASPGETATVSGTLENPYLFVVQNVTVNLSGPSGWDISATGETSFDTIESQSEQSVSWEITVPDDASGANDLTATVEYESTSDAASVEVTSSVSVYTPGDVPQEGLEAYFSLDTDTPTNAVTGNEASVVGASPGEATGGATGIIDDAWEFTTNDSTGASEFTVGNAIVSEQLPINGEAATVGAWINHPAIIEDYGRVYHVDSGGVAGSTAEGSGPTNGWNIEFSGTDNAVSQQYWDGGDLGADTQPTVPVPQDEWIFVVSVVDGNDITIYTFDEDGQLDGSPGTGGGTRAQSDSAALILMAGDGRDTPGRMDEVRAYSRALSEEEVMRLYNGSIGQ